MTDWKQPWRCDECLNFDPRLIDNHWGTCRRDELTVPADPDGWCGSGFVPRTDEEIARRRHEDIGDEIALRGAILSVEEAVHDIVEVVRRALEVKEK